MAKSIVLLIVFATILSCKSKTDQSHQKVSAAKEFIAKNQYDSALSHIQSAINLDTSNGEAYFYLAKCLEEIDNTNDALWALSRAANKNFNQDSVAITRRDIYFEQERFDECITVCNEIIGRNFIDYNSYYRRAASNYNKSITVNSNPSNEEDELLKRAMSDIDILLKIQPNNSKAILLRGVIKLKWNDTKGAQEDFKYVLNDQFIQKSTKAETYRFLGIANYFDGALEISLQYLDSSLYYDSHSAICYYNRGNTHIQMGNKELACQDFNKALELGYVEALEKTRTNCNTN